MEQSSAQNAVPDEVQPADISPEARRRTVLAGGHMKSFRTRLGISSRVIEVMRRVVVGCFNDGTIHAGNLAYMSLLAIFPFFITATAIISAIGSESDRLATVAAIVRALPPTVADVIEPVARTVIEARTGWFLWIGAFFGLWTTGSLIETIRDILRRSYGTRATKAFWKYRISSVGIIVAAVLMLIVSLVAQVTISAAQNVIQENFPQFGHALGNLSYSRIVTAVGLFFSIWMLFVALTPHEYRGGRYRKWPGALLVTGWWTMVALAFPPILRSIFAYDLTYGSLAGVMITLFFFWLVGLGIVAGAELNAALSETPEEEENRLAQERGTVAETAEKTEEIAR
ncbi:YihY/virulence factor BrkB family protein [Aurantiacibacter zhengii]|uniref:YihY/virulence factor BrkB family protein n=1 Tax=Aurantiacibacter zhengii TaxID=2307003 RepID=A0A418NSW8_9SPHN|nr:YihY/virulence factor BrkB family protein [Aurantiacibacter zhengii]RIV86592.1 YihY/virulence factor BrkB family protein [Aurantiacibacter zhengii]